jgi:hypothetical protein
MKKFILSSFLLLGFLSMKASDQANFSDNIVGVSIKPEVIGCVTATRDCTPCQKSVMWVTCTTSILELRAEGEQRCKAACSETSGPIGPIVVPVTGNP